jgi:hypothetical protein
MVRLLSILEGVQGRWSIGPYTSTRGKRPDKRETKRYRKRTAVNTSFLIDKNILALVLFDSTRHSRYVSIYWYIETHWGHG